MKKQLLKLWRPFVIWYSNLYWKNAKKEVKVEETKQKDEDIFSFVERCCEIINYTFRYTRDGIRELGDTIPPPAEAYFQMKHGELKDDCDGFHACLFHMVQDYTNCMLVEIYSLKNTYGHCVLMFDGHICDYGKIMTQEEAKQYYAERCEGEFVIFGVDYDGTKYINLGEIQW